MAISQALSMAGGAHMIFDSNVVTVGTVHSIHTSVLECSVRQAIEQMLILRRQKYRARIQVTQ